jgi:hypothetical protein
MMKINFFRENRSIMLLSTLRCRLLIKYQQLI